jgi:hypothetical protein
MGEERTKVEDILKRIDDLVRILKFLSEDLIEISKSLKGSLNILKEPQPPPPLLSPKSAQQTISFEEPGSPTTSGGLQRVDGIQKVFPKDLAGMLHFEVADKYVLVKPRQYLGSDSFRRIAAIIRDKLNGEYVSAGKDSHFRIPRT